MSHTVEYGLADKRARMLHQRDQQPRRLFLVPRPDSSHATPLPGSELRESLTPDGTVLEDWPLPREFAPLIAAAAAAGDETLLRQLRDDQRFCSAMRRKLGRSAADMRRIM
jgi:hypothetical protein